MAIKVNLFSFTVKLDQRRVFFFPRLLSLNRGWQGRPWPQSPQRLPPVQTAPVAPLSDVRSSPWPRRPVLASGCLVLLRAMMGATSSLVVVPARSNYNNTPRAGHGDRCAAPHTPCASFGNALRISATYQFSGPTSHPGDTLFLTSHTAADRELHDPKSHV